MFYNAPMNAEKLLENINGYALDSEQKASILEAEKFSLIVAGAGSGKTLTLVGKIRYLIEIKQMDPKDILCISFTNEATKSLKEKINIPKVQVYTFHKLAIEILNKENIDYQIAPDAYLEEKVDTFFNEFLWNNSFLKKQFLKGNKTPLLTLKKYKAYLKTREYQELKKWMTTFIHLYNTNNLKLEEFKTMFQRKKEIPLLYLIYAILNFYEKEKMVEEYLDFDDLIKKATKLCKQKTICHYKEIIIDEFQDTSKLRLEFVKSIVNNSDANLTVVGDDFQSIYKFSGCDLNIFLNFQEFFPKAKIFKIQTTYRNSQELIKLAGDFVMKNKSQIHKDLKSNKHLEHPLQIRKYYNKYNVLLKTIKKINTGEILILGRNNFDIYKFIPKEKITWKENGYFKLENYSFSLRYLTVHKSKGLESDNVIIINLENTELGFPCQKKDTPLTHLIQEKENFLYEEERRLFYVALTRTKNVCYLLVPYFNASIFAKEIKKMK